METAILAPGLLLLLALLIGIGRTQHAHQAVEAAARDAARQASIARDPRSATAQASGSARAALQREGLRCTPVTTLDTAGLDRPVGTQAAVTAQVACQLPLSDLLIPGLPGETTIRARFSSPIDPYRGADLGFTNSEGISGRNLSLGGR
ncbi:TadE/TadG family type IV pilus assembly protein [Actinomadura sp. 7K507]|uniref:TadE/TadG family type IV pilus assembly protein n=1 Tax=Actinomadura sp. 7K507 TaxID=2530365 RepID=UPI001A9DFC36|nr:TadE/TadG family type IV pilus assembly protein [Actinomadura sp. 7K507]